ncbi:cadmium-translocating P-type ATPase [Conexibacter sp. W3-3-2]|uniref:heavy metal translocating P-type ATPase n=1 Tax=Conexibacter sp. W3-3-2 TaxID=2675227 RepID=UPI0012B6FE60|nr:cation-translocating P-type ATPase [Conexibacter sp. W3-3-2]MTD43655.1 cadmium-translocating P-type ATPase [Conexibacter sp. W3-3-2]
MNAPVELPMAQPAPAPSSPAPVGVHRLRIEGMDCGSCATTLERTVRDVDGVERVAVTFSTGVMTVDGPASDEALRAAVRRAGFTVRDTSPGASTGPRLNARTRSTLGATALLLAAIPTAVLGAPDRAVEGLTIASILLGGWPIARAAVAGIRARHLDMNVLMTLAAVGALAIGEHVEAALVVVLFAIGTTLESLAMDRSRRSVEALLDLAPLQATVLLGSAEHRVDVGQVPVGALVVVRPGERIALDGVVHEGESAVDESALTGEAVPVTKTVGSEVFAGTFNEVGSFVLRVTADAEHSTLARIAQLVADAQGTQAPSERFVDRFARRYTPIVVLAAAATAVLPPLFGGDPSTWVYRGLALLIVACPCALVISVPVSVVSAIGGAARRGVLIKGGQALEDLGRVRVLTLDKTGTLTEGRPELRAIEPLDETDPDHALALAAAVERRSEHPLARAIVRAAEDRGVPIPESTAFTASPGRGARATVETRELWVGGPRQAREHEAQVPPDARAMQDEGQTAVMLGEGSRLLAVFGLADRPRSNAAAALTRVRELDGVEHVEMLTGDSDRVAAALAGEVGLRTWQSELLPGDKLTAIRALADEHGPVAMVGDGINDAPALTAASVGIAMGAAGSDIAIEAADVALMADDLDRVPDALAHGSRALRIMRQNIAVSLATKIVFVALAPLGYVSIVVAVIADMGVSLLVTANGLRLLRMRTGAGDREAREQPGA